MNKEQQALDELRALVHSELDGTRMLDEYLKHCDTLQELVDKAIPKKVTQRQETDVVIGEYTAYDCPACKQEQIITFELEIVGFKAPYCRHCSQALDWSNENDKN